MPSGNNARPPAWRRRRRHHGKAPVFLAFIATSSNLWCKHVRQGPSSRLAWMIPGGDGDEPWTRGAGPVHGRAVCPAQAADAGAWSSLSRSLGWRSTASPAFPLVQTCWRGAGRTASCEGGRQSSVFQLCRERVERALGRSQRGFHCRDFRRSNVKPPRVPPERSPARRRTGIAMWE